MFSEQRKCYLCGKPFTANRNNAKYCNDCRKTAKNMTSMKANKLKLIEIRQQHIKYTDTTDMLITQLIDEGNSIKYIASFLNRDIKSLENHIEWMKENYIFEKQRLQMKRWYNTELQGVEEGHMR